MRELHAQVDAVLDGAVDLRRALHAEPELAGEEVGTTAIVRERLRSLGLEELRCPTPTGAVFRLEGGRIAQLMAQEFEQSITVGADGRARRHHHAVAARARELMREQQLIAAARSVAIERGQHDHVEFQPLRLVNGHDFHRTRRAVIGIQIRKAARQIRGIGQAALLQVLETCKGGAGEFQVLR